MQRVFHLCLLALLLPACHDATDPGDDNRVRGLYRATLFTAIRGTDTTDLLADGARLHLSFAPDSTLVGLIQLPGADSLILSGLWLQEDSVIAFKMDPPTLLEQMRFHHRGRRLEVDTAIGPSIFQISLSKQ